MKKTKFRLVCVALAFVLLLAQLFAVPMTVFADDPATPPTEKPENYIRDVEGNVNFTGDFSGGRCLVTKRNFPMFNLKKYDYIEFDIYFSGTSSGAIRFYFLDDKYKDQNAGRGFFDFSVAADKWTHIKVKPSQFDCGYDMNGKLERTCGTLFERGGNGKSNEQIVVANMCVTADRIVSPDTMPDRLLTNIGVDVELTAAEDLGPDAGTATIKETDFTYGDYLFAIKFVKQNQLCFIATCFYVLPIVGMVLTKNWTVYLALYFLHSLGSYAFSMAVPVFVTEIVPYEIMGAYTSWRMMFTTGGTAVGSLLSGFLLSVWGVRPILLWACALQFLSGLVYGAYPLITRKIKKVNDRAEKQ